MLDGTRNHLLAVDSVLDIQIAGETLHSNFSSVVLSEQSD